MARDHRIDLLVDARGYHYCAGCRRRLGERFFLAYPERDPDGIGAGISFERHIGEPLDDAAWTALMRAGLRRP